LIEVMEFWWSAVALEDYSSMYFEVLRSFDM
jgi:hypothetical protein